MPFAQTTTIQEIIILPLENNVQVKRRAVVTNDGEVVSTNDHYQLYAADDTEVVAILQDHSAKAIADAMLNISAKSVAESALAAAQSRIAELESQLASQVPAPATNEVSARQIRQALNQAGLRAQVETAVAAGDQNTKDWWDYANTFDRNHTKVVAMGEALGVSNASLDDLWALAASL